MELGNEVFIALLKKILSKRARIGSSLWLDHVNILSSRGISNSTRVWIVSLK